MSHLRKTNSKLAPVVCARFSTFLIRTAIRIRSTSFIALLLSLVPLAAEAVQFAPAYLIKVDDKPLLKMTRKVEEEQKKVEITLTPSSPAKISNDAYSKHISHYMEMVESEYIRHVQPDFQTMAMTLNRWATVTQNLPELQITLNENQAASQPTEYVLAGGVTVEHTSLAESYCQVSGSNTIATVGDDGESFVAQPLYSDDDSDDRTGDEKTTYLGSATGLTPKQAACMTISHAHGDPSISQSITMFGLNMEVMFADLMQNASDDEGLSGEMNQTMSVENPLTPLLMGNQLSISGIEPTLQSVTEVNSTGFGHQFTFDPDNSTITQEDPNEDPNPSGISFVYHINQDGVIDSIIVHTSEADSAESASVQFIAINPEDVETTATTNPGSSVTIPTVAAALFTAKSSLGSN